MLEKKFANLLKSLAPFFAGKAAAHWLFSFLFIVVLGCASQKQYVASPPSKEPLLALNIASVASTHLTSTGLNTSAHFGVSLAAVGDVMLGSWVVNYLDSAGSAYPFAATKHILQAADIAIANLEAPFTDRGAKVENKEYTFRVPPKHAAGLKESGFDILHLANNHILDFGPEGLFDTIATLDSLSLLHIGAGENIAAAFAPVIVGREHDGKEKLRLGFLGFSMTHPEEYYAGRKKPGTAFPFWERYVAALDSLAPKVDIMIVSFHWGAEKMVKPKPYQIDMAHAAIDRGAAIVIGHHPHVLQGIELYRPRPTARQGLIAYSLGNFAFGSYSPNARISMILKCVMDANGVLYARCLPINVFNDEVEFQPQLLQDDAATAVIDSLNALSRHLNNGQNIVSPDGFVIPRNEFMTIATTPADSSASDLSSKN
jgi:poly-gamma-glutamate synthesis protein (capsule biosynthesis protein)